MASVTCFFPLEKLRMVSVFADYFSSNQIYYFQNYSVNENYLNPFYCLYCFQYNGVERYLLDVLACYDHDHDRGPQMVY